jgi:hypothetical protein
MDDTKEEHKESRLSNQSGLERGDENVVDLE